MVIGARQAAAGGQSSLIWLVLAYFLHTTGELCLSPVGLSTVTRLSPTRLVGLMMGMWFMSNAFAGVLSGVIAKMTTAEGGFESTFLLVVYFAGGAALVLLILTPLLNRLGPDPKLLARATRLCPHPDCKYANQRGAEYCAQCGRKLERPY